MGSRGGGRYDSAERLGKKGWWALDGSTRGVLVVVVLLHALPFATRPRLIGGDEPHYALMAHSIAVDHDLELADDYQEVARGSKAAGASRAGTVLDQHIVERHGRSTFAHPLGLPLLAAPVIGLVESLAPGAAPDIPLGLLGLVVSLCALLMGRDLLSDAVGQQASSLVAFSIYFATPLWFYSRTLFTEPYVWSFSVMAIWLFRRGAWLLGGLVLSLPLACKEVSLLLVLPTLFGVLVMAGWRRFVKAAIGTCLFAFAFAVKNLYFFGESWVTFQEFQRGSFAQGFIGLSIGSRHGLLWFAPLVILLPVASIGLKQSTSSTRISLAVAMSVFVGYLVVTALWVDWGGGSSYGPRLLVPGIAALGLPLALAWRRATRAPYLAMSWGVCAVVGFVVQWCAAINPREAFWSPRVLALLFDRPWGAFTGLVLGTIFWRGLSRVTPDASTPDERAVLS